MKSYIVFLPTYLVLLLHLLIPVFSVNVSPIPENPASLRSWSATNIIPFKVRKNDIRGLEQSLVDAESQELVISVRQDGLGQFKTITEAIDSIPWGNNRRVIIRIGPGVYKEKINIDQTKPFITFFGSKYQMPKLTFHGTAAEYGTVDSASVIVSSDYFMAVNVIFENSSPMPDGIRKGAQAVAMRISGDKAAFYNCKFLGFQDTLCDDRGNHFFKDCYVEGTVDYIFGDGKSLYLNTELRSVAPDVAVITAQARVEEKDDSGFSFVHCLVSGPGNSKTYLGRAWKQRAKVVFIYSDMGTVVNSEGWNDRGNFEADKTVFYGEYKCKGPGANPTGRVKYVKMLTDEEVKPYLDINYINGSYWILPPPKFRGYKMLKP
ncbi:putative pectinesterase 63 [Papaver somniferum]|uniref:putative pectinesterase 63 n=1 Tax=Papaver somniferum TaxID=3469 RepID=UPI000E6FF53F|nr:putative pectinesterase 63 [Papaver somniferum]